MAVIDGDVVFLGQLLTGRQEDEGVRGAEVAGVQTCALPVGAVRRQRIEAEGAEIARALRGKARGVVVGEVEIGEGHRSRRGVGRAAARDAGLLAHRPGLQIGRASCRVRVYGAGARASWEGRAGMDMS